MIKTTEGTAKEIYYRDEEITKLVALIEDAEFRCINYNFLTGEINAGDRILLNTTAVELDLGTGGFHFVTANLSRPGVNNLSPGHIMKLKYTPMQISCLTVEAQESPYHDLFTEFSSLEGMPVIVGSLHSVLAPCSVYLKKSKPDIKICYVMTEGGALPIYVSDIVRQLKQEGIVEKTITYGSAFGGDYECVNVYTALAAAKKIVKADIAIVCMGPGIVGTETVLGFSGAEQGSITDAVNKLGGFAVAVPRISFADFRARHYGISHHSLTVLKYLCCTRANIAVPRLEDREQMNYINSQLEEHKLISLHNIFYVDLYDIIDILPIYSSYFQRMGKSFEEDREYFVTCAAAAKLCLNRLY